MEILEEHRWVFKMEGKEFRECTGNKTYFGGLPDLDAKIVEDTLSPRYPSLYVIYVDGGPSRVGVSTRGVLRNVEGFKGSYGTLDAYRGQSIQVIHYSSKYLRCSKVLHALEYGSNSISSSSTGKSSAFRTQEDVERGHEAAEVVEQNCHVAVSNCSALSRGSEDTSPAGNLIKVKNWTTESATKSATV